MAKEQGVYLPDGLGAEPQPSRKKRIWKVLLILLLLVVLIAGGFLVGIYMRIFDTNTMNEKLGLYDLPIIGQFFVKPAPKTSTNSDDTVSSSSSRVLDEKLDVNAKTSKPVVLTKAEIEKQMKAKQAEEKKRVSKLARLYNEMKPAEAASVMDALDDDMTIAILQKMDESQASKVLAKFDPDKSARLTKLMYTGTTKKLQTAGDTNNNAQDGQGSSTQTQNP